MNSYQKLIGHIKSQDWHKATNTFREVMEQKIALRLGEEQKRVAKRALTEADVPPTKCKKCGKTSDFKADGWCKDCWDKDDTVKESEHSGVFASENCGKK